VNSDAGSLLLNAVIASRAGRATTDRNRVSSLARAARGISMTLSDLSSIGSLVSGLAVLGSLVYLGRQVKQAEKNQQATIRQGRIYRAVALMMGKLDPSVSEAVSRGTVGDVDISVTQLLQFTAYAEAYFLHAEDTYYQHDAGLLDDAAYETFVAFQNFAFTQRGFRAQWKNLRSGFGGGFATFMDKLLAATRPVPPVDALAQWKADIAADESGISVGSIRT
jgi:hypothetical protein